MTFLQSVFVWKSPIKNELKIIYSVAFSSENLNNSQNLAEETKWSAFLKIHIL